VALPDMIDSSNLFLRGWNNRFRIGNVTEKFVQTDWQVVCGLNAC